MDKFAQPYTRLLPPVSSVVPQTFSPPQHQTLCVLCSPHCSVHSLSLFFLRVRGGTPCGPVVEVFIHRPQLGPPPALSGPRSGPPPPPVLLPPAPLPKLAHLRPGPPRVPPRSAPGPALLLLPQPLINLWFRWDCACSVVDPCCFASWCFCMPACFCCWLRRPEPQVSATSTLPPCYHTNY